MHEGQQPEQIDDLSLHQIGEYQVEVEPHGVSFSWDGRPSGMPEVSFDLSPSEALQLAGLISERAAEMQEMADLGVTSGNNPVTIHGNGPQPIPMNRRSGNVRADGAGAATAELNDSSSGD